MPVRSLSPNPWRALSFLIATVLSPAGSSRRGLRDSAAELVGEWDERPADESRWTSESQRKDPLKSPQRRESHGSSAFEQRLIHAGVQSLRRATRLAGAARPAWRSPGTPLPMLDQPNLLTLWLRRLHAQVLPRTDSNLPRRPAAASSSASPEHQNRTAASWVRNVGRGETSTGLYIMREVNRSNIYRGQRSRRRELPIPPAEMRSGAMIMYETRPMTIGSWTFGRGGALFRYVSGM